MSDLSQFVFIFALIGMIRISKLVRRVCAQQELKLQPH